MRAGNRTSPLIDNMKAELITRFRNVTDDGTGIEMVVWHMPEPVPSSGHPHKYRLIDDFIEEVERWKQEH